MDHTCFKPWLNKSFIQKAQNFRRTGGNCSFYVGPRFNFSAKLISLRGCGNEISFLARFSRNIWLCFVLALLGLYSPVQQQFLFEKMASF